MRVAAVDGTQPFKMATTPASKEGYEPEMMAERPIPKFHMAVDSEYKVRSCLMHRGLGWMCCVHSFRWVCQA